MGAVLTGAMAQSEGFLFGGMGPFGSGSELEKFLELLGLPGEGRVHPGVIGGVDVDDGSRAGVGLAEDAVGAFLGVGAPGMGALEVGGAFGRAVEEDAVARGVRGVSSHGQAGGAEGEALVIDLGGGAGGSGMEAVSGVEGDDGLHAVADEVFVEAVGIVEGVVDRGFDLPVQAVLSEGLLESVEAVEGEGTVGLGSGTEGDVEGEIMALGGDDVLVEGMPEVVGVGVGVESPVGSGIGVEAGVVAAVDPLLPAGAGGGTVGVGAGAESGSVAGEDEVVGIAYEASEGGGEDGDVEEEIFEALEEVARTGLLVEGVQAGGQFLGEGVELGESLLGLQVSGFLLGGEVSEVEALSEVAG